MAAVMMVDSGSQSMMVAMTHDSKYRLQRRFILSYLLIALLEMAFWPSTRDLS